MEEAGESASAAPEATERRDPALVVVGLAVALLVAAVVLHTREVETVGTLLGPVSALVVDGGLAAVLLYRGQRLVRSDLETVDRRTVVRWCVGGAVVGGGVIGLTIAVRAFEGRSLAEPAFPLLTATAAGAIAGLVAGHQSARAQADARRARIANEALQFVNSLVRHDLRNDLVAISGYAEPEDLSERHHEMIRTKADEALERIETTRAVAETLAGTAEDERVDLARVVREVVADVRRSVMATVEVDAPETAPVLANPGVRSVVDNLVENAVEHNDADDPRVEVRVEVEGEAVRLVVADDGPGLPADQRARLEGEVDAAVAGGGLSIVRRLAETYGSLSVEDREPRGTVFSVTFERAD